MMLSMVFSLDTVTLPLNRRRTENRARARMFRGSRNFNPRLLPGAPSRFVGTETSSIPASLRCPVWRMPQISDPTKPFTNGHVSVKSTPFGTALPQCAERAVKGAEALRSLKGIFEEVRVLSANSDTSIWPPVYRTPGVLQRAGVRPCRASRR